MHFISDGVNDACGQGALFIKTKQNADILEGGDHIAYEKKRGRAIHHKLFQAIRSTPIERIGKRSRHNFSKKRSKRTTTCSSSCRTFPGVTFITLCAFAIKWSCLILLFELHKVTAFSIPIPSSAQSSQFQRLVRGKGQIRHRQSNQGSSDHGYCHVSADCKCFSFRHFSMLYALPQSQEQRARIDVVESSHSLSSHEHKPQSKQLHSSSQSQPNGFDSTIPFNQDIARTLFPPLFFSLYHYQNQSKASTIRHHLRSSPFQDPSSAQTTERMLRRMMENWYRSDGRTACPDARTFGLVAGAFGRLRSGNSKRQGINAENNDKKSVISWDEEPKPSPQQIYSHQNSNNEDDTENSQNNGKNIDISMTPLDKLQELLHLQLQLCKWEDWPIEIRPNVVMFNRVLKRLAWRNRSDDDRVSDAEEAWQYLQLMKCSLPPQNKTTENNNLNNEDSTVCPPNAMTYAHVVDALAGHRPYIPSTVESLDTTLQPTLQSIGNLAKELDIEVEGKSPANASMEWYLTEADTLLAILEEEYKEGFDCDNTKEGWSHSEVMHALIHAHKCLLEGWGRFAVAGIMVNAQDTGALNKRGNYASTSNEKGNHSTGDHTSILMDGTPLQKREYAIRRAHELLCRLEELENEDQQPHSQITRIPSSSYASVILALSTSNLPSAAPRAEKVLNKMMSRYGIRPSSTPALKSVLYSSLLDVKDVATAFSGCIAAYAKVNDAPKAEHILNQMIYLYDDERLGSEFVPEVRAFGTCISIWAKFNSNNYSRAEAILFELERVAEIEAAKYNDHFILHATPYNIVIQMLVKSTSNNKKKSYYSKNKSDYHSQNFDAYDKNEKILHAMSLLDHMEYEMGVTADAYTYSILLHALLQQSGPGNEQAADQAEELLRRRMQSAGSNKTHDVWGSTNKHAITNENSDTWPNVKHYSSVLKAHAKTKSAGGARKALALLSEMERRYADANILYEGDGRYDLKDAAKPDLVCYSIVIDAFANSRLPEASDVALRLLRALETKDKEGDATMKPNTRVYTAVILSLVNSPFVGSGNENDDASQSENRLNNAQKAWSILQRMKRNNVLPNSFTYNYIINCASQAPRQDEEHQRTSFEIAIRAFQELRKTSTSEEINKKDGEPRHPDSFTYAFMLKACTNLLPHGAFRTKVMTQTFLECCRSGYLNDAVLGRLRQGVSTEDFYEMIDLPLPTYYDGYQKISSGNDVQAKDLPDAWSRSNNSKMARGSKDEDDNSSWKKGVNMAFK